MNGTRMTGGLAGIFFGFLVFVSAPYAYEMNGAGDDLGTYNEDWQSSGAQVQEAANVLRIWMVTEDFKAKHASRELIEDDGNPPAERPMLWNREW